MIATTIGQSKKLLKYGLNPDTADMVYTSISDITGLNQYILEVRNVIENFKDDEIPAWSLSALIDISYNCGWYSEKSFEAGQANSETILTDYVEFVLDMLTDFSDDKFILRFQEKYKEFQKI